MSRSVAGVTRAAARISVIIPALDEADHLEACLASIADQEGASATEIIVVDGGSTDATREIAARAATVIGAPRGRGSQLNAGARAASGNVLLFLHADSTLHPRALAALGAALTDPGIVGGTFTLRFDRDHPLLRFYAWCTRMPLALFHYGDQGIFVRRDVYDGMCGFREWPLMEDVDFLARLRRAGRTALLPLPVTTSARRFARHGVVRQQMRNAILVLLFRLGVSPHRLAAWYGKGR